MLSGLGAVQETMPISPEGYGIPGFAWTRRLTEPNTPLNREQTRRYERTPAETVREIQGNPLFQEGQAVEAAAPSVVPLSPEEEASKWTKAGRMAGGFVPMLAAGELAPVAIGVQSLGGHLQNDFDQAKAAGADEETAASQALDRAVLSGGLQGAIFAALPAPLRAGLEKYVVDRFGVTAGKRFLAGRAAAAAEGAALGGTSTAAENVASGRPATEGVASGAEGLGIMNLLLPWLREKEAPGGAATAPAAGAEGPPSGGATEPSLASRPAEPTMVKDLLEEARRDETPEPVTQESVDELLAQMRRNQVAPSAAATEEAAAPVEERGVSTQLTPTAETLAQPAETERALTSGAEGVTKDVAAPETKTGATAGETPGTPAETAAPPVAESGTIPVEANTARSAAASRTRRASTDLRGWDLLDEAESSIGTIDPKLIKEANPDWKPVGAARKIFKSGGTPADVAADSLFQSGIFKGDPGQPDQLGEAANAAARARVGNRRAAAAEDREMRQAGAFERDRSRPGPNQRVVVADDLQPGDTLKIRGAPFKVREFEYDEDGRVVGVTLDDGAKYGTRVVGEGVELNIDKRSLRRSDEPLVRSETAQDTYKVRVAREGEQGAPRETRSAIEQWADEVLKGGAVHQLPEVLAAYVVKGAAVIARIARQTAVDFTSWSSMMINELGQAVIPHLKEVWRASLGMRQKQLMEEMAKAAVGSDERKGLDREQKDIQRELGRLPQAEPVKESGENSPQVKSTPVNQERETAQNVNQPEAVANAKARLAELNARIGELTKKIDAPGGEGSKEARSERFALTKEAKAIERELSRNPEHVADLLRTMDRHLQEAERQHKAGNGAGRQQSLEEARGIMEGQLQRVPAELRNRIYNELVAKGEIMGSNRPELPAGRTLGELTDWLHAQKLDSPKLSLRERFSLANRLADEFNRGKDAATVAWFKLESAWRAFVDQWKQPPHDTDFRRTIKEWFYQKQWTGLETHRWIQEIRKSVPNALRRMGISVYLDAGGDMDLLRAQADMVPARFRRIWDAALNLTPGERSIADRIRVDFEQKLSDGQSVGLIDRGRADYGVPQVWSVAPKSDAEFDPSSKGKPARRPGARLDPRDPFFSLERKSPSYFDGIMNGGVPKGLDVADLVGLYNAEFHNALADRAVIKQLKDAKDTDGNPIVKIAGQVHIEPRGEPIEGKRVYFVDANWRPGDAVTKDGRLYQRVDHWALRDWKFASKDAEGNPVLVRGDFLVHPDYVRFLKNELGKSWLRDPEGGGKYFNWLLNSAAFLKASKFASATFHLATIGEHAMFHAVSPISRGVDLDPRNNPKLAGLMRNGLEQGFGHQQELFQEGVASHGGIWGHVPGLGDAMTRASDFLFKRYIPAIKAKVALAILDRNLERYGKKLTEDQIYELTARQANAAFGLQNWRLMGTNKTLLDVNRLFFTAPDFLLSRSKVVAQALKPYNREQRYFILAQAGVLYLAARALNLLFDDDPHWEPQNAFSVVHNGKAYSARFLVNDLWNMAQDFTSNQAGFNFLSGRLGPVVRTGYETVTGRDMRTGARVAVPFETDNKALRAAEIFAKGLAGWLVPMGVEGLLPGAAGRQQTGLGQAALALVGVGSRRYTAQTQMFDQAAQFNRNSPDPAAQQYQRGRDNEARSESQYRKLSDLLEAGELDQAAKEYDDLVHEGTKPLAIAQHYNRTETPFTGSRAREQAFKQSLNAGQLVTYQKAIQERVALRAAFQKMMGRGQAAAAQQD